MGIRTRELGLYVQRSLVSGIGLSDLLAGRKDTPTVLAPVNEKEATAWASVIAGVFGALKSGDDALKIEQLAHISPDEIAVIEDLIGRMVKRGKGPTDEDLLLLREPSSAVDIAMFGRMLAAAKGYNIEAAVQVAHAISVHEVAVEDDFFTAVDDLNRWSDEAGAGHMGDVEFAAGLFYLYVCINRDLLVENVGGNEGLADDALRALTEAAIKVGPTGKQATFASRAYASYVLAEKGIQQPRSLSVAYLAAIRSSDLLNSSIAALKDTRAKMEAVYGPCCDASTEVNAHEGTGSLDDLLNFVAGVHG